MRDDYAPGFFFRASCVLWNIWYGFRAPADGLARGALLGYHLSPKLSFFMNLVTSYIVPASFVAVMSAVGICAGTLSGVGCFAESLWQVFAPAPYKFPLSRMMVDWLPPV